MGEITENFGTPFQHQLLKAILMNHVEMHGGDNYVLKIMLD